MYLELLSSSRTLSKPALITFSDQHTQGTTEWSSFFSFGYCFCFSVFSLFPLGSVFSISCNWKRMKYIKENLKYNSNLEVDLIFIYGKLIGVFISKFSKEIKNATFWFVDCLASESSYLFELINIVKCFSRIQNIMYRKICFRINVVFCVYPRIGLVGWPDMKIIRDMVLKMIFLFVWP